MAQAATIPIPRARTREATVPWYLWMALAGTTSAIVGVEWDISWHRTIGRDTFLTPAHLAIYLCGVLAGISCGYLILAATFQRTAEHLREASVSLWGFRGPIGAFIAAWGGIAMLTSAPFDDWWHSAYGLDVKIISPPHIVLALGIFGVELGALMLVLGRMNRADDSGRRLLEKLYLYQGGLVLVNVATIIMEYTFRLNMHSAMFYRAIALAIPLFLVAVSQASTLPWAATRMALVYMLLWNGMNWILPLFPAEPKLGPVFNPVTHFVPSFFSLLLVFPALAVDWLLARTTAWGSLTRAAAAGAAFVSVTLAAQWPFANFLVSPWSRNWFFHTHLHDYRTGPNSLNWKNQFFQWERTPGEFWSNLAIAFAAAILFTWIGLHWSRWLRRLQR